MLIRSRTLCSALLCTLLSLPLLAQAPTETINIDARAPARPFPHFWEQMFGSGHASLSLRAAYRGDLRAVRQITGFQYVRFHGIFLDDVGVYDEDKQGHPIYNFSYVDQIHDGLLADNAKPFVELSFMPYKLTQMMSYWTFSDVFEEQGIVKEPFYGGFGLLAAGGIPKPSFYAFQILHKLGDQRIENSNPNVLVTRSAGGPLSIAVWNIANPGTTGVPKTVKLEFKGVKPDARVGISRVDSDHGNSLCLYQKMGSPRYPTKDQIHELREQSQLPDPAYDDLADGSVTLQLPVNGLAIIQVR